MKAKITKVYSLSDGEYSDYRVKALFPTRDLAERAVEAHEADPESWGYGSHIEEFWVYSEIPEKSTAYHLMADIWDDGTVGAEGLNVEQALPWNHLHGPPPKRPNVRYVRAPIHKNKGGRLEVYGSDEQSVRQAFGDNKARILAEQAGIT